ncbi:nodulation protein NodU [Bradyrhizobium sp. CCBAU 11357]|uniref:nodulation protein NodU n=1 Tax=Bradyrhizobium sp. CCBAU 11357 TaxID=1630808 RepID=UPI0023038D98|nr:nodulation protein NodU [Bradyrhizobium sp. CCBAU 11357]MDA9497729.1 nodulation protein NodU [Bradyrhizobium sp. CCBAU 11357]
MRICGIKLTHDGAIALVEDGRLLFCVEQEKRDNNPRYHAIDNLDVVVSVLAEHGLDPRNVDQFAIDGWLGDAESQFQVLSGAAPITLKGAPYLGRQDEGLPVSCDGFGLVLDGSVFPYASYPHVTGHLASGYCTSPFAKAGEPAFCLVWDGGTFPRLYHISNSGARYLESLFPVNGDGYASAGHHFGPYKRPGQTKWDLGLAGKLMAYIALGSVDEEAIAIFREICEERLTGDTTADQGRGLAAPRVAVDAFFDAAALRLKGKREEDVLASFHSFLERLLVDRMAVALQRHSRIPGPLNLIISGGCGLNIKWNSSLRAARLFDTVWVPPFPNDAGSAIGAACCAMAAQNGFVALEWSVYSGPALRHAEAPPEWDDMPCSISELAAILANNEPVIFLAGRAELGPRALGNRSILAAATSPQMKDNLNDIKLRERFRPVAPICLEDRAPEIFSPGTPDPYMLFDHQTRAEWRDKIPAVVHLDGSARLQTISRTSQQKVAALLVEYEKLTGIPLLCNTSANYHGRGFFPDVAAACQWGRVKKVWSDARLLTKRDYK